MQLDFVAVAFPQKSLFETDDSEVYQRAGA